MTDRDKARLVGCHRDLVIRLAHVLTTMEDMGHPMIVTDGARTVSQQQAIWAQGRTTPGPDVTPERPLGRTVTYADGVEKKSKHQSGRAADCAFLVHGHASWDEHLPWEAYGEAAEAEGLEWGGRWPEPRTDKPHVQWSLEQLGVLRA